MLAHALSEFVAGEDSLAVGAFATAVLAGTYLYAGWRRRGRGSRWRHQPFHGKSLMWRAVAIAFALTAFGLWVGSTSEGRSVADAPAEAGR